MLMVQPPSSEHQNWDICGHSLIAYLSLLCGSVHVTVSNSGHLQFISGLCFLASLRPEFGLLTLKGNSPFDQGLEAMVSTSIPFTAITCTVTCPEVAHCVWRQFWLLQMSFCHWAELSVSLHTWSSEETTFCTVPCQSPAHTQHGLSTPRKYNLAS